MALASGARLGAYEVLSLVGAGGMGEVYKARDTRLNRDIAIKVLPEQLALDPDRLARLKREAQVLASLNHPNIAAIYGFEEADGVQALVLELVEGPTLADRIARGRIPLDEALPMARQIAEALEAAHEQGIIHRDLKPANIKVRDDGTVKVLDFGLAKALEPAGVAPSTASLSLTITTPAMTQAGIILGTAAYMSPEQAKGKPADKRSDLWAFGGVLYEMLTGARAFGGEDISDTLAAVLRDEADWRALPAGTPASIRRLLRRCLEKDRRQRLADAADARLELDEAAAELTAPIPAPMASTPVPQPVWKRATPIVVAGLIGALAAGSAVRRFTPAVARSVARFPLTLPEGQAFTNTGRQVVAISPDGNHIAYVANHRLYTRALWEAEAKPIAGTDSNGVLNPVFSPDGQMIAFWQAADATIKRIALVGGAAVPICPATSPFGLSWTRDGILIGQVGRIVRCDASGGASETFVTALDGEVLAGPQRLPGTNAVLFTVVRREAGDVVDRSEKGKGQVVVQSLDDGRRTVVVETGTGGRYLPTGHLVYEVGGVLFAAPFDPRAPAVVTGVPVIGGIRGTTSGGPQFSVSETGSLLYLPGPTAVASSQRNLALLDLKGGASPLRLPPGPYEYPRLSPDETHVAFNSDTGTEAVVWIYDLSGTTAMRHLTQGGRNRFPVWSPDGQHVAFQSDRDGDLGIFRQRADGTGTAERLTKADPSTSQVPLSWSPDGRYLLYDVRADIDQARPASDVTPGEPRGRISLMILSVAGKTSTRFGDVRSSLATSATFSPDGQWVAYTVSAQARGALTYVQPFPATGTPYEIGVGGYPVWSPDGTSLLLSPAPGQFRSISVTTKPSFVTGEPVPVQRATLTSPTLMGGGNRAFDIGRNGKIVGLIETDINANTPASASQMQIVLNWFDELKQRMAVK
jgi:Tol biopolymer transport system component